MIATEEKVTGEAVVLRVDAMIFKRPSLYGVRPFFQWLTQGQVRLFSLGHIFLVPLAQFLCFFPMKIFYTIFAIQSCSKINSFHIPCFSAIHSSILTKKCNSFLQSVCLSRPKAGPCFTTNMSPSAAFLL